MRPCGHNGCSCHRRSPAVRFNVEPLRTVGRKAPCAFCPVFVDSGDHRKYVLNAYDSSAGTSAFFEEGKK